MLLKQTGWVPPGTFDILGPYFQRLVSPQFKIHAKNVNSVCIYTAPTWKGDLNFSKWGPKGDLILSEMGTKRGPSAAEKGTKRGLNGDLKSVYLINWPKRANSLKKIFVYKKSSPSVLSFSAQLGWGISINKLVCNQGFNAVVLAIRLPFTGRTLPVLLALYSGCTDFWRVLRPKMEKRGLWTKKGTKKLILVPMGTKVP